MYSLELVWIGLAVVLVLATVIVLWALWNRRKRRKDDTVQLKIADLKPPVSKVLQFIDHPSYVRRLYRSFLQTAAQHGLTINHAETSRQFGRRVEESVVVAAVRSTDLHTGLEELCQAYEKVRYVDDINSSDETDMAHQARASFQRILASTAWEPPREHTV